jgi:ferredoxin
MVVIVDKDACIGCGSCEAICPEVFGLGEDGKAHVKDKAGDKKFESVKEALEICPVGAIKIE